MKRLGLGFIAAALVIVAVLAVFAALVARQNRPAESLSADKNNSMQAIAFTSPAFPPDATIPARFTCDGKNVNPPLEIGTVPVGTKTLALIMEDPDAPNGLWVHWVKFNMPPNLTFIAEGKEPPGTAGAGSGGNLKYYGPCPPSGKHHYYFKIYALDSELAISAGAPASELEAAMEGHLLGQGQLVGFYSRHN